MFFERRSIVRGALQLLSLLRRLNTCLGQGKIEVFSSENELKYPVFSLENRRSLSGNGSLPRSLVPLYLQTGFRYFSAIPQQSRDEDLSELDAKEMNEAKGFKEAVTKKVPSLTSIFSNRYGKKSVKAVTSVFSEKNEKKSVKSVTCIFSEKNEEKSVESVTCKYSEKNEEKSVESVTCNYSDKNEEKSVESVTCNYSDKNEKKSVESVTCNYSDKNEKKSEKSVTNISSKITEKKKVTPEQQQEKMPETNRKAEEILEHPWPEWVRFIMHLNNKGYLSRAFHFQGPILLQGLSTEGIYAFIEYAAFGFAKDRVEISKLSGSDLKKVALYCCPSVEKRVVFAAERLRSFYSTEDVAYLPSNVDDTSNPPSVESEVKRLELEDVVRLLCAYGLNAEKREIPIPDGIKQSVVNLLKELVDTSASSVIGR